MWKHIIHQNECIIITEYSCMLIFHHLQTTQSTVTGFQGWRNNSSQKMLQLANFIPAKQPLHLHFSAFITCNLC